MRFFVTLCACTYPTHGLFTLTCPLTMAATAAAAAMNLAPNVTVTQYRLLISLVVRPKAPHRQTDLNDLRHSLTLSSLTPFLFFEHPGLAHR
jgi:hypothetical protein